MLFSTRLPLDALVILCRSLRHGLGAGLSLVDVFGQQGRRGPPTVRPVAERVARRMEGGDALDDALEPEAERFPPLFMALAQLGEKTGHLPETFGELEQYFRLQQQLRRQFISDIAWPVFQLCAAVVVLTLLILVVGLLDLKIDPLGLGLRGPGGAAAFLFVVGSLVASGFMLYQLATRQLPQRAWVNKLMLRIPALGPTLEALALARLCLALRLTLGGGLGVKQSLKASFKATGNPAYELAIDEPLKTLKRGESIAAVLTAARVFPEEFLHIVETAEEAGRLPEVMQQQAEVYQEESARRMKALTQASGLLIYLMIAGLLAVTIVRIYMTAYLGPLQELMK